MSTFEITLKDRTVEIVEGADSYQQEGQMTTFFATGDGRQVVDCWSTRLASFRTTEVVIIRRGVRVLPSREPELVDGHGPADTAGLIHLRSA